MVVAAIGKGPAIVGPAIVGPDGVELLQVGARGLRGQPAAKHPGEALRCRNGLHIQPADGGVVGISA